MCVFVTSAQCLELGRKSVQLTIALGAQSKVRRMVNVQEKRVAMNAVTVQFDLGVFDINKYVDKLINK